MPADLPAAERPVFEPFARLLAALAVTALAVYAWRWAFEDSPPSEDALSLAIAAIAAVSAFVAWMPGSLLLRSAFHLATLWVAAQTLQSEWSVLIEFDAFVAGTAAFFAALALRALSQPGPYADAEASSSRVRWTTGELLSGLFVLGAYTAIGKQLFAAAGPNPVAGLEIAVLQAGVPYLALTVAVWFLGRVPGSVAVCLAATVVATAFPEGAPVNPFATVLIVALSALSNRDAPTAPAVIPAVPASP